MLGPLESLDEDEEDDDEDELPVVSPTDALTSAIVPAIGARRLVAASAFSALVTLSSALSTAASAAASEIWLEPVPPEPVPLPLPDALLLPDPLPLDGVVLAVCLGVVVVDLAVVVAVDAVVDESDWTWSSVSCADWRSALACARSTFWELSSMVARSSSAPTCSPSLT
jgi:hypothetical protein